MAAKKHDVHFRVWDRRLARAACKPGSNTTSPNLAKVTCKHSLAVIAQREAA